MKFDLTIHSIKKLQTHINKKASRIRDAFLLMLIRDFIFFHHRHFSFGLRRLCSPGLVKGGLGQNFFVPAPVSQQEQSFSLIENFVCVPHLWYAFAAVD
jgi:hypothetical protein